MSRATSVLACWVLLGCTEKTTPVLSPSNILEPKGKISVVAYDGRGRGAYLDASGTALRFCAEPPPDVTANLSAQSSSSTKASLDALLQAVTVKAALDHEHNAQAASTVVDVANRTEVLLVLRESLYRLCEMNLNGSLTNDQARSAFDFILRTARLLGQRDNVSKLIEARAAETDVASRHEMLQAIVAMSLGEVLAGSTGLSGDASQAAAASVLDKALDRLYSNDKAATPAVPVPPPTPPAPPAPKAAPKPADPKAVPPKATPTPKP